MKIHKEFDITEFEPWSGAVSTYKKINELGKLEMFGQIIEDTHPDGIDETELNDILWFEETENLAEWLGLYVDKNGELTDEEPTEDEDEEENENE